MIKKNDNAPSSGHRAATVNRLRVALGTLIGVRECLQDALVFANRGIETTRKVIQDQNGDEVNTTTASLGEMIDQWRRMGQTWGQIADILNGLGYRNKYGRKWTGTTIPNFYNRHFNIHLRKSLNEHKPPKTRPGRQT